MRRLALILFIAACSSHGSPEANAPSADERVARCNEDALSHFDPGSAVRSRTALSPMKQRLEAQTVHVVSISCEDAESDDDCLRRARSQAREQYPSPAKLAAQVVREPNAWRAQLLVDGSPREVTVADVDALAAHIEELRRAGHTVLLVRGHEIASEDAPRSVQVQAVTPPTEAHEVVLRTRLTLEPPVDEVGTMLRLHRRARVAGLSIQTFTPLPDGAIVVELSCRRRAEGAAAGERRPASSP